MTQTATPPSTTNPERKNPLANLDWRRYVIYIGFAVVFLFFAITLGDDGFLTGNNLLNIVRQTATSRHRGRHDLRHRRRPDRSERRRHGWPGQCRHRHDHRQLGVFLASWQGCPSGWWSAPSTARWSPC